MENVLSFVVFCVIVVVLFRKPIKAFIDKHRNKVV